MDLNWKKTRNRFVVFLDILGFKKLVENYTHDIIFSKFELLIDILEENINIKDDSSAILLRDEVNYIVDSDLLHYFLFSDSIIIFSKDDNRITFNFLTKKIRRIYKKALELNIPLKGCVSHGLLTVDNQKNIFFGQPLIDSYLLQEDLDYIGIVSDNSINTYIESLDAVIYDKKSEILIELTGIIMDIFYITIEDTPLISGRSSKRNLCCFDKDTKDIENLINEMKKTAPNKAYRYYDNTLEIFEKMKNKKDELNNKLFSFMPKLDN